MTDDTGGGVEVRVYPLGVLTRAQAASVLAVTLDHVRGVCGASDLTPEVTAAILEGLNEGVQCLISPHAEHGQGTAEDGPDDPDCACRGTAGQRECARVGCGFCRVAEEGTWLLHLVDVVWGTAYEDGQVPATDYARKLIADARATFERKPHGWCPACTAHRLFKMAEMLPGKLQTAVCATCETPISDVTYRREPTPTAEERLTRELAEAHEEIARLRAVAQRSGEPPRG